MHVPGQSVETHVWTLRHGIQPSQRNYCLISQLAAHTPVVPSRAVLHMTAQPSPEPHLISSSDTTTKFSACQWSTGADLDPSLMTYSDISGASVEEQGNLCDVLTRVAKLRSGFTGLKSRYAGAWPGHAGRPAQTLSRRSRSRLQCPEPAVLHARRRQFQWHRHLARLSGNPQLMA